MRRLVLVLALVGRAALAAASPPASLDACDAGVVRAPHDPDAYRCYVVVANATGRIDDAVRRVRARLAIEPDRAEARFVLAHLLASRGDASAETEYRLAISGFERAGSADREVAARLELATLLAAGGRPEASDAEIDAAREAAVRAADPFSGEAVRIHEAWRAFRRTDYAAAEAILTEVESSLFPDGPAGLRSEWLSARGSVLWAMTRYDDALACYERQVALLRAAGNPYEEAVALSNAALLASRSARTPEAWRDVRERIERAMDAARRGGNLAIEAKANLYLGQLASRREEQRAYFRRAVEILGDTGELRDRLLARRLLAGVLLESEPPDPDGFALLTEAEAIARGHGDLRSVADAAAARVTYRWRRVRAAPEDRSLRERAVSDADHAFDVIEAIRDEQSDPVVGARVFAHWAFLYDRVVGSLLWPPDGAPSREDVETAFRVLERHRDRERLHDLDASGVESRTSEPPPLATLADVEHAVADDEVVLSFAIADTSDNGYFGGASWLFVHRPGATTVRTLPDASEIGPAVDLLVGLLPRRDGSETAGARRLYRELLAPELDGLDARVTRLVIVPDGALHRLPFAALLDRSDRPLGARFRISIATSVSAWLASAGIPDPAGATGAVAFADPAEPEPAAPADAAPVERAFSEPVLGPLPWARREARALRDHLGSGARVALGREASESAVKRADLRGCALLHFATHTVLDDRDPRESSVVLAPGGGEDGLLHPDEIAALDLRRRVVVLSGCRSAGGPVVHGTGVLGIARACFASGATAVVGSLWPIRDDDAAALFDPFYRRLAAGASLSDALLAARRERIAAGAPAAAWAGVVVLGDGDAAPFPGGRRSRGGRLPFAFAVAIFATLAAAALLRSRRRADSAG